ncbi:MAG: S41 family peptidase [Ginsengibacter sp.]
MNKLKIFLVFTVAALQAAAQKTPLWLRYPVISPDGKNIVFSFKGDLYKVSSAGGTAYPLTLHEAHDFMPVWSHDGKKIAFASDRFGNFDVFVIDANGGEPTRLTYNSAADYPWDFSPDDSKVIFGTTRNDIASSARFPVNSVFKKLYEVPVNGGRSIMLNSAGMENVHYNSKGTEIIFQDNKGYEDPWRKHHTSSITRDIWLYTPKSDNYKKLTSFNGEDREPVFSADDKNYFYLNEKSGSLNVYEASFNGNDETQLTKFKNNPVRFLSRSDNNSLCFTYDGEIYTLNPGGEPQKVSIIINSENKSNTKEIMPVNGGATEFELSPNGKEIAFVFRGEVFVTSVEGNTTKRITNTPYQERTVSFSPDGRSLYYAAEHEGTGWDIMKTSIARKEEPYFYASTILKTEPVVQTDKDEFQPEVSPDGKEVAYLEERNILKVYNLDKKTSRTVIPKGQNFSYADGDQSYTWSPDSKWIAARSSEGYYGASEIVLFNVNANDKGTDVTESGFSNAGMEWALNGKALLWVTDRNGKRPLAYQGAREVDIYAMFFDKETYDQFQLSKDEYSLLKEKEDKTDKTGKDSKEKPDSALEKKIKEPFKMDLTNLDTRRIRLTSSSINLGSFHISPKGDKLYFTAKFEKGYDLWEIDTRTHELKTLAKLNADRAGLEMSKDGKTLFVLSNGKISQVNTADGKVTPISINSEMVVDHAAEREYIFNHAWRQVKKKLFDPNMNGVDWEMYKKTYAKFLPFIADNYDFRELLSEMLGELDVSHTGGRYRPDDKEGDETASLGLLYDETQGGKGLKIAEVISGGPLDKAESKIAAGQTIMKIDGNDIDNSVDWAIFVNRKNDMNVLLTVYDPATKNTFDEVVRPMKPSEESQLLYRRWTKKMEAMVNKLSDGKVGYVHVQAMNDNSYRDVYDEVLGKNLKKDALIVDTRFNGGGWLHEDLSNFLSGKQYIRYEPYGEKPLGGGEPQGKWWKPSCVVMNEANYSDAHMFPYTYHVKGIGKLIGMPVPGTGTAVWWETQIDPTMVFGIPMIASVGLKEGRALENMELEPDIRVQNDYNEILKGEDQQIEAAVKEMLSEIKNK